MRSEFVHPLIYEIVDKCTRNGPKERYSSLEPVIIRLSEYAKALEDEQNAPKSIKEIKEKYAVNTPQFNEEVYKTLRANNHESMVWGDKIQELKDSELKSVFLYKREYLNDFAGHFIECLADPSDSVQFSDIDQFARVLKVLVDLINDIAIKQNLIQFLAKISIDYNRYPAMEILAEIVNGLSEEEFKSMRVFFIMNKNYFNQIMESLGRDNIFDIRISKLL